MSISIRIGGIGLGRRRGGGWSPTGDSVLLAKILYWGVVSEISGGQMPNKITGSIDFITVAGSPATYQAPDVATYKSADTDKIWFKYTANLLRTVTTAELIGYDFARTMVKYDNTTPYTIREIIILKSGEVLTATEENNLRDYMQLSVWWSNVLSLHGAWKGNRGVGQSVWTAAGLTLTTGLINYYLWNELAGNLIDVISANNGTVTGATRNQVGPLGGKAYSFDGNDKVELTATHTFLTTDSFSVALWMKAAAINTSDYMVDRTLAINSRVSLYKVNADASFYIHGSNTVTGISVTKAGVVTTDWIIVVGVRNVATDTIEIYVNGVASGSPVTDTTTSNIGAFTFKFGMDQGVALPYEGLLGPLGIWRKALTPTEILELTEVIYPF